MRKLLLILTLCFPVLVGFRLNDGLKSGRANSSSGFIDITVLSNIDKQFFQYNLKQQCLSNIEEPGTEYAHNISLSHIIIPVKEFKCTNKSVYKDFLTLLKVDQYPYLEIDIPHNSNIKYDIDDSVILKGVSIIVAGVSNQYDINCKIDKVDNENQILNGVTRIKLTDFEIVPPVRLLGLVKVKNEIIINFEFCLKSNT
jgi:hypothetical protein